MQHKEDICMHGGEDRSLHYGAVVPPIYQNSLFVQDPAHPENSVYSYSRSSNPTVEVAEAKIAELEMAGAARCFSSGMGAISSSIMHHVGRNDHILAARGIYGPARMFLTEYLARFGIETTLVDGWQAEDFEKAARPNTKLVYLESPGYGVFRILDLAGIAQWANSRGLPTVIDNTYSTPLFQNPLQMGIQMVVHSASKYLGGHSDIVAGAMAGSVPAMQSVSAQERSLFGACMDPHQASLLTRGIRTLPFRMRQHQESALRIATYLEGHPKVAKVHYPWLPSHERHELARKQMSGCSGLLSFELANPHADLTGFKKKLKIFGYGPSWGGFESLIIDFSLTEEEGKQMGIPFGLIRLSTGLEHAESLLEELETALCAV
jgi:cystathionine beta-lyase/cystathionine gamma-synthase